MNKQTEHIGNILFEVAEKILANREKPRKYGTGRMLYPSEVNAIAVLGERPGMSVTELAEISGVTKGAVSQLLNRLADKGMVTRREDPANLSRINIHLTALGKKAYRGRRAYDRNAVRTLLKNINGMKSEELAVIERFLKSAQHSLS